MARESKIEGGKNEKVLIDWDVGRQKAENDSIKNSGWRKLALKCHQAQHETTLNIQLNAHFEASVGLLGI